MDSNTDPAPGSCPDSLMTLVTELRDGLAADLATQIEETLIPLLDTPSRPEPLLTIDDVADHLRVSRRTVETLLAEGEIIALRIRGTRRFTREAVNAYIRSADPGTSKAA